MDYHILDVYTLKAMSRDIKKEIRKLENSIDRLNEQLKIIDIIVSTRDDKDRGKPVDDNTVINPTSMK